ncbi:MAG TPA: hypothetical protein PLJ97_03570 [Candidatus Saccharibacteria bacterium]|mgnify:CR=1 FL=1|nr:hypothetical protein [Candidatus Saccharibacteria bacterium]
MAVYYYSIDEDDDYVSRSHEKREAEVVDGERFDSVCGWEY